MKLLIAFLFLISPTFIQAGDAQIGTPDDYEGSFVMNVSIPGRNASMNNDSNFNLRVCDGRVYVGKSPRDGVIAGGHCGYMYDMVEIELAGLKVKKMIDRNGTSVELHYAAPGDNYHRLIGYFGKNTMGFQNTQPGEEVAYGRKALYQIESLYKCLMLFKAGAHNAVFVNADTTLKKATHIQCE
jgi:hypothetical protein